MGEKDTMSSAVFVSLEVLFWAIPHDRHLVWTYNPVVGRLRVQGQTGQLGETQSWGGGGVTRATKQTKSAREMEPKLRDSSGIVVSEEHIQDAI